MAARFKSSTHSTKYANLGKRRKLRLFLKDYSVAVNWYIEFFWNGSFSWVEGEGENRKEKTFDVKHGLFDTPKYAFEGKPRNSDLSARALKRASMEALGVVKSITKKIQKATKKII